MYINMERPKNRRVQEVGFRLICTGITSYVNDINTYTTHVYIQTAWKETQRFLLLVALGEGGKGWKCREKTRGCQLHLKYSIHVHTHMHTHTMNRCSHLSMLLVNSTGMLIRSLSTFCIKMFSSPYKCAFIFIK